MVLMVEKYQKNNIQWYLKFYEIQIILSINKILLAQSNTHVLTMGAFMLIAEDLSRPTEPKILTVWSFSEKPSTSD